MLITLGLVCLLKLSMANYLIIKDFRNGQNILHINIAKISSNHCFGPIFNLKSQSLCGKLDSLSLSRISAMYKRVFDVLSENQSRLEMGLSCPMVISKQYNCSIKEQMSNANRLDFKSVIYTTTNTNFIKDIVDFAAKNPFLTTSVIMIGDKDGEKLLRVTNSKFCYAQILGSDMSVAIMMTYIFIVGVAVLLFYAMLKMTTFFKTLWLRVRYYISLKMCLSNLEIKKFKAGDFEDSCSICLIEFSLSSKIRKLTCGHGFHPKCIDHWIRSHKPTCPLCNQTVDIPNISRRVKCTICTSAVSNVTGTVVVDDGDSWNTVVTTTDVEAANSRNTLTGQDAISVPNDVVIDTHDASGENQIANADTGVCECISLDVMPPSSDIREGITFTDHGLKDETA